MITESLRNIIVAAGFTPSQLDLTLLLQALPGAVASRPEMARSLAANGYQKLPGGLILQWGVCGITASGGPTNGFYYGTAVFTFPITFPSSCLIAFASPQDTAGVEGGASVGTPSATSVSVVTQTTSSGSAYANVFAIGK